MNFRNLTLGLGLILLLCVEALLFAILVFDVPLNVVGEELVKSLLQVIIIVFIGQLLSLTGTAYTQYREKVAAENKFRSDFFDKIIPIYATVNSIRLKLRDSCNVLIASPDALGHAQINIRDLDTQMQIMNDRVNQEIITMIEEVRIFQHIFSGSKEIISSAEKILQYFDEITGEYRAFVARQAHTSNEISVKLLPNLGDFLLTSEYSAGRKRLVAEYETVKQTILKQILQSDEA